KGLVEFVNAAEMLKKRGVSAQFVVVGDLDTGNPASISRQELEEWRRRGTVTVFGFCSDIFKVFSDAHVVVLPSYREGLPKVLVEAAACGRPVVTTDIPGCRDAIEPDITDLLVPVKNATALA